LVPSSKLSILLIKDRRTKYITAYNFQIKLEKLKTNNLSRRETIKSKKQTKNTGIQNLNKKSYNLKRSLNKKWKSKKIIPKESSN